MRYYFCFKYNSFIWYLWKDLHVRQNLHIYFWQRMIWFLKSNLGYVNFHLPSIITLALYSLHDWLGCKLSSPIFLVWQLIFLLSVTNKSPLKCQFVHGKFYLSTCKFIHLHVLEIYPGQHGVLKLIDLFWIYIDDHWVKCYLQNHGLTVN